MTPRIALAAVLLALVAAPGVGRAQATGDRQGRWNSERVLELVRRGRDARARVVADTALRGYRARATGHVYFLVDRDDAGERTLVKADQLALDVFWRPPDRTRQRIVGRRDERKLPTNIKYHLDHLTIVTDDFDDRISLGDGEEIRSVLHPLAPHSGERYDFRLADSLSISFPAPQEAVRVYEVEVRPRSMDEPGYLGSVFLDRATAAVVRMSFTFTPASYVDPYLDHIRISLNNSRWRGRFWLPYRQEVEIRRELPQLDFPAGSIIQARWRIGGYDFDPELPEAFFLGPSVTTLPAEDLASYDFEEGLYEPLETDGLVPPPDVEEVRRQALAMAGRRYLSGLRRLRLFLPSASSGVRYNRAEGLYLGGGLSFDPLTTLALKLHGGYAFGADRISLSGRVTGGEARPGTSVRAYWNDLRDLGPLHGTSGVVNSFSALALDTDYLDPFYATGASLTHRVGGDGGPGLDATLRWEEHDAARRVVDAEPGGLHRPVRPVEEGTNRAVEMEAFAGVDDNGATARLRVLLGRFDDRGYAGVRGLLSWTRRWLEEDVRLRADLHGGAVSGDAPVQSLFHLGGRGTLPGYGYRSYAGDRFTLLRTSASWGAAAPWIRPRITGAVGWTDLDAHRLPSGWNARPTPISHFSAGVGAGLFWDIFQLDASRGLNGGEWVWELSIARRFWPWL